MACPPASQSEGLISSSFPDAACGGSMEVDDSPVLRWAALDGSGAIPAVILQSCTIRDLQERIAARLALPLAPRPPAPRAGKKLTHRCACTEALKVPLDCYLRDTPRPDGDCKFCRKALADACMPCSESAQTCELAKGPCDCGLYFHVHCLERWFLGGKAMTCPGCLKPWTVAAGAAQAVDVHIASAGPVAHHLVLNIPAEVATVAAFRRLIEAEASKKALADVDVGALVMRQMGKGLLLSPDAPLPLAAGSRIALCGRLSPCASFDVNVEVRLPGKTIKLDMTSLDAAPAVCREVQSREGLLAARVRLFALAGRADSPAFLAPSSGAAGGAAAARGVRLEVAPWTTLGELVAELQDGASRELGEEGTCVKLFGEVVQGQPPFVELDFFGRHGRRLPNDGDGGALVRDAWPSVDPSAGDLVYVGVRSVFGPGDATRHSGGEDAEGSEAVVGVGVQRLFTASAAWVPWPHGQSEEGVRRLCATLHVVSAHCTPGEAEKITAAFRAVTPNFPPAADALRVVLGRRTRQVSAAEQAALARGVLHAIQLLAGGSAPVEEERLFEVGVRVLFFWLLREAMSDKAASEAGCWAAASIMDLAHPAEAARAYGLPREADLLLRLASVCPAAAPLTPWQLLVRQSQKPNCLGEGPGARWAGLLQVLSPLALQRAPKPSLTRDEDGHICVFTGSGKDVSRSTQLFLPSRGEEVTVDAHHVMQRLKKLGLAGETAAAATENRRPAQEAIMVLLDTSNSMDGASGFARERRDGVIERAAEMRREGWDTTPPEDGSPERVRKVIAAFKERPYFKDLCQFVMRSQSSFMTHFAREAAWEARAREVLQELCRMERLKPDADPDVCRIFTRDQDVFVSLLCSTIQHSLAGSWRIEITAATPTPPQRRQRGGAPKKKQRVSGAQASSRAGEPPKFTLPSGSYELELVQVGDRVEGKGKGWDIVGKIGRNMELSFDIMKDGTAIAHCTADIAPTWRELREGKWQGDALGSGSFTGQRVTESALEDSEDYEGTANPPAELLCPITQQLMTDPVTCADGHSYERAALEHWVRTLGNCSSPLTGERFYALSNSIVANHALRKQIEAWRAAHPATAAAGSAASGAAACGIGGGGSSGSGLEIFQLFCKTLTGRTIVLHATKETTVQALMEQVAQKIEVPASGQRLIYAGRQLDPEKRMKDYNLEPESTLHLVLRLREHGGAADARGGAKRGVVVKVTTEVGMFQPIVLMAHPQETVESLMFRVWCAAPSYQSDRIRPSATTLWRGLKPAGDGFQQGSPILHRHLNKRIGQLEMEYFEDTQGNAYFSGQIELTACKLYVPMSERPYLSRLGCVKQLFHAFINRSQAYDYPNEIGLVLFGDEVTTTCPISPVFEDFRQRVDEAGSHGDTRLYDALDHAADELEAWREKNKETLPPDVALRVLVLSDGQDTSSGCVAWQVARRMQRGNIIVDAITIGGERDRQLHALAKATGGYVFQPSSLANALRLNELEVLLSVTERPKLPARPRVESARALAQFERDPVDECDEDRVPQRRKMPLLALPVRELNDVALSLPEDAPTLSAPTTAAAAPGAPAAAPSAPSAASGAAPHGTAATAGAARARQRRAIAELRLFQANPHPAIEVFPSDDLFFWKLLMEGPEGTPYHGGLWALYCHLPAEYPECPPQIRFVTPIRHCNVNAHGRVCHSILDRNYTTDTTVLAIMHCIYGLLLNPDYDDPLDSTLALEFYEASGLYEDSIRRHVGKHATWPSREELRRALIEGGTELRAPAAPGSGEAGAAQAEDMEELQDFGASEEEEEEEEEEDEEEDEDCELDEEAAEEDGEEEEEEVDNA